MNLAVFLLVLLGNLWIWRIFLFTFFLGVLVVLVTLLLYFSVRDSLGHCVPSRMTREKHKSEVRRKQVFILLFVLLLFFQWKTTDVRSLTNLSNDEQREQQMRLKEYPPVYIKLDGKTLWIPMAHWFEGRRETIAAFRILENVSEVLDPNLYFFANHPRERVGYQEFEKFPYILLPFFVFGTLSLIKQSGQKKLLILLLSFAVPTFLISIIGSRNMIGPLSLFPFIVVTTSSGLNSAYRKIQRLDKKKRKTLIVGFLTIYLLVFLQMISYAIY